jgi:2-polyprenyl-3-methyl-5-hydroxy-6-metoxy-1,4-benzoquinol methylase
MRRSDAAELMDAPDLDEAVHARCLGDLAAVNRVTFTHRATLRWLRTAMAAVPAGRVVTILDVACGHGDLLRAIARCGARARWRLALTGIDLNPRSALAARAATPAGMEIDYVTGDVFTYAPVPAPDFIVSSQFTHHLAAPAIIKLLGWLEAHSARGWHITDLHRHRLAYHGFAVLARAMRWQPIVRHDGQVSVARGFTAAEWRAMAAAAGLPAQVRWRLPFRHSVSHLK